MKYSTDIKQISKCMERLDVAKMPYLERLRHKRYGRRALQFAWKHVWDEWDELKRNLAEQEEDVNEDFDDGFDDWETIAEEEEDL